MMEAEAASKALRGAVPMRRAYATPVRDKVLTILTAAHAPMTAHELLLAVQAQQTRRAYTASIYGTLHDLEGAGGRGEAAGWRLGAPKVNRGVTRECCLAFGVARLPRHPKWTRRYSVDTQLHCPRPLHRSA